MSSADFPYMLNMNPLNEPIESISNAWFLRDGSLYLTIRCADGVYRTAIIPVETKQHPCRCKTEPIRRRRWFGRKA